MKYEERTLSLSDGRVLTMRSPTPADAETMIAFIRTTAGESDFLLNYPEEVRYTLTEEEKILADYLEAPRRMMITLFDGSRAIGNLGLSPVGTKRKIAHRASLAIAIVKAYWGMGLGRRLMEAALAQAKAIGYEQAELGTFSENLRAQKLYGSLGFERVGVWPRAFRLKDGTYQDEILMVKRL